MDTPSAARLSSARAEWVGATRNGPPAVCICLTDLHGLFGSVRRYAGFEHVARGTVTVIGRRNPGRDFSARRVAAHPGDWRGRAGDGAYYWRGSDGEDGLGSDARGSRFPAGWSADTAHVLAALAGIAVPILYSAERILLARVGAGARDTGSSVRRVYHLSSAYESGRG